MILFSPGLILAIPWILIWLIVSSFLKAWLTYRCWDTSHEVREKMTLNPKVHIDLYWLAAILFFGFGWSKSLDINERKLNDPYYDPVKIAIFSVLGFAIVALFFTIFYVLVYRHTSIESPLFLTTMQYIIYINWSLFFFNMLPIPPFTWSIVLFNWLKIKRPDLYHMIYWYSSLFVLVLILVSNFTSLNIFPTWFIAQYWWDFFLKFFSGIL
jgi:Zn-dependent protease